MVGNDEPDIIVGGPSAPPIATAVPAGGDDPSAAPMATAVPVTASNNPSKNIERTTNVDGSIAVKATTTSRRPNGYRDVTIEYFYVPANMAGTVIMSMDSTGEPPSSLYLTKMEQQVLPPGTGEVMSHAPSSAPQATTGATTVGGNNPVPQPYIHENAVVGGSQRGSCAAVFGCVCIIIVAVGIVNGVIEMNDTQNPIYLPPTYAPYPWPPYQWTSPTPTPARCKDTPGWVDQYGFECDWYDGSGSYTGMCSVGQFNQGSMGPPTENCCACGGGSTYIPPTQWPTITPIISPPPTPRPTHSPVSACKDTPNWVDLIGLTCDTYTENDFMCDSADTYMGDMGPAAENCCACGGGAVSYTPPPPATSNTAISTPTPTNPADPFRRRKKRE
mmetsp:Transcript_20192/g.30736  ORF Transcript_20192/g.30736 Transcript_20192/m.30736 type:complete len:388 (+) Transcript_20192:16-1179(+)